MTETSTDAFLSGQGIPVEPARIEAELTRLWGPAAEQIGGPVKDNPNVTRVVLANLIVQTDPENSGPLIGILDEVVARFPSRSIVLGLNSEKGREIKAEVAALCHLPAPGMPQVCSERILLQAGPEALDLLPGAVRPLLETNLPVVLWWTGDPRETEPLFRDLADEATRIVLDLPDPGADPAALRLGLDPELNIYARDSAWFGISRWRELIAQFFDGSSGESSLSQITSVTVEAVVPEKANAPRLSVWLVAWLAGQLGWEPVRRTTSEPGQIQAIFRAQDHEVSVTILTKVDASAKRAQLFAVTIETTDRGEPASFRLARPQGRPNDIRVEVCSDRTCALPRVVIAPDLDAARRIAGALESARHDPPFSRALPHLLWLLSS